MFWGTSTLMRTVEILYLKSTEKGRPGLLRSSRCNPRLRSGDLVIAPNLSRCAKEAPDAPLPARVRAPVRARQEPGVSSRAARSSSQGGDDEYIIDERNVYVQRLRARLADNGLIETARGFGYRVEASSGG